MLTINILTPPFTVRRFHRRPIPDIRFGRYNSPSKSSCSWTIRSVGDSTRRPVSLLICSALLSSALSRVIKVLISEAAVFASCRMSDSRLDLPLGRTSRKARSKSVIRSGGGAT